VGGKVVEVVVVAVIVDGNGVVDVSARANMKKFQKIRSESNI
jgi:hypothetical protein